MRAGNPNATRNPVKPTRYENSRVNQGRNPMGIGRESLMGGVPQPPKVNSIPGYGQTPEPQQPQQRIYTHGPNGYEVAGPAQADPYTQMIGERLVGKGAAAPSLMQAYLTQHPETPAYGVETGYQQWLAAQLEAGLVEPSPTGNGYQPTQAFYQQVHGWVVGPNGQMLNMQTTGGQRLADIYGLSATETMGY